jgi:archaeal flagellar protein FlaF
MAVAELIGAAIGVLLLVMVAYLLVGSTLSTAELVVTAQKDVTLQQEARMHTQLSVTDQKNANSIITANVTNTGTEIISDFNHMDVLVYDTGLNSYQFCTYDAQGGSTSGTWIIANRYNDFIHPNELDPGEKFQVQVFSSGNNPKWFQFTTANGVYASGFL